MVRAGELSPDHTVRLLDPDDWATGKRVRLEALAADPGAFGSTLEREQAFTEADWRQRFERRATWVAMAGDEVVGLVGGYPASADRAELVSMWVRPDYRGRGVAASLVNAVVEWASRAGHRTLSLWVVEGNVAAEKAYAKSGFQRTGRRQPVREGDERMELEMARATSGLRRTS